MTATTFTTATPTVSDIAPSPGAAGTAAVARPAARGGRWALWGAGAGVLGVLASMITDTQGALYEDGVTLDHRAIGEVERWGYHAGVVAGLAATFCLLVAAAGWRRWAAERAPGDLAAGLVPLALTASAGAMILGYGMKGSLAVYLPGGMDEGSFTNEGLFSVWMFLDFAPYVVWWGVCFAAAALGWLSLRSKLLPRWVGALAVPFVLAPVGFMVATGLPGFPGVVDSTFLTVVSIGLAVRFSREARAAS